MSNKHKDNDELASFMRAPKKLTVSARAIRTGITRKIGGVMHECYIEPLEPLVKGRGMTVRELIALLETKPPDLRVMVGIASETGFDAASAPEICQVREHKPRAFGGLAPWF